ncbi:4'-phosphopantetheinyl transferase family protein [Nonomuraea rhizosphaerae]|uniref:4'-phosphopantetheinyl transferase family protein n=1 Tax=Nonomuraea rhizosphaerae TaxID=2665663 RepID=UPI001C5D10FE|nr:4'-phosphopantetheinyl transferase superfamily protein [Nonomuraea rhizosphaerae]
MGGRPDEVLAPEEWLTDVERARAARFAFEADRRAFVAAHLLVRLCAAEALGTGPDKLTLLQHCYMHGPGHGVPSIEQAPSLGVAFSHTRGYVCAVAGAGRVGIDAERVPPGPFDELLAGRALSERELAVVTTNDELIRRWARKESLIKRGELTIDQLRSADADLADRHLLEWSAEGDVVVAVVTDTPATRVGIPAWG